MSIFIKVEILVDNITITCYSNNINKKGSDYMETKSIVFTIKTAYSREKYFLELEENTEKPWEIKDQIETALISKMCFCDAYDLVKYKEVDEKYITKRENAISKLKNLVGDRFEDNYPCWEYMTLESLRDSIRYEKEMEDGE